MVSMATTPRSEDLIAEARGFTAGSNPDNARVGLINALADALEGQMQDREMLVMFLRNTEQDRDELRAVIEKARECLEENEDRDVVAIGILSSASTDVLRERDAEKWDEGAQWAAVELGAIDNERQAWITPTDNPYRQTEEEK